MVAEGFMDQMEQTGAVSRLLQAWGRGDLQARDDLMPDQALVELTPIDLRQGQIVELRYFGGLSEQDVGEVLSISRATVTREWQTARAWLYRRITTGPVRKNA